MGEQRNR